MNFVKEFLGSFGSNKNLTQSTESVEDTNVVEETSFVEDAAKKEEKNLQKQIKISLFKAANEAISSNRQIRKKTGTAIGLRS